MTAATRMAHMNGAMTGPDDTIRRPRYRRAMIGSHRIEGYAIISADGMIADGEGEMPPTIRNDADQKFLQAALDRAALIVHGRHSNEGGPRAARRKRVVLTRRIASLAPDTSHPNAWLWNPAGATFEQAVEAAGIGAGVIAIIGGTEVFGIFLPRYDAFHMTLAANAKIPGGTPVFPQVGGHTTATDVLASHGLKPGPPQDLDAAAGVTLTTWERQTT
jgi:dihydrofolate reductase